MTTNGYFTADELRLIKNAMRNERADLRRKNGYTADVLTEDSEKEIERRTRIIAKLGAPCMY